MILVAVTLSSFNPTIFNRALKKATKKPPRDFAARHIRGGRNLFLGKYRKQLTSVWHMCYTCAGQKEGDDYLSKKMGRPTTNPRPHKLSIRINERSKQILEKYTLQKSVNKTEAIERGIGKLEDDLKQ